MQWDGAGAGEVKQILYEYAHLQLRSSSQGIGRRGTRSSPSAQALLRYLPLES